MRERDHTAADLLEVAVRTPSDTTASVEPAAPNCWLQMGLVPTPVGRHWRLGPGRLMEDGSIAWT